jgi:hypothetical protein
MNSYPFWETRYVTLREECRLRVFGNRILRHIFGLKRDEKWGVGKDPQ